MRSTLLIVAAGSGSRLRAGLHKALVPLADGRTMLEHCLDSVLAAGRDGALELTGIIVVVPADPAAAGPLERVCREVAERSGTTVMTVPGGAERADSVRAGLAAVRTLAGTAPEDPVAGPFGRHAVLVHDAARPFVPSAVFRAVGAGLEGGAAAVVPGVPVVDTVKTVSLDSDREWVTGTPSRSALRAVQTPQGFDLTALEAAHRAAAAAALKAAPAEGADGPGDRGGTDRPGGTGGPGGGGAALTDDAMVMEAAGHAVLVVPGDPLGFKITTPLDLVLAEALLRTRLSGSAVDEENR